MPLRVGSGCVSATISDNRISRIACSDTPPEMSIWEKIKEFFFSTNKSQALECIRMIFHPPKGMTRDDVVNIFEQLRTLAYPGFQDNVQSDLYGENHFCILDENCREMLSVTFDDTGRYTVKCPDYKKEHNLIVDTEQGEECTEHVTVEVGIQDSTTTTPDSAVIMPQTVQNDPADPLIEKEKDATSAGELRVHDTVEQTMGDYLNCRDVNSILSEQKNSNDKSKLVPRIKQECALDSKRTTSTDKINSDEGFLENSIPKDMHFVWEGKDISAADLSNILLNSKLSPGFSVNIWTTRASSIFSTLDKMLNSESNAQHRYLARKFGSSISVNNTKELYNDLKAQLAYKDDEIGDVEVGEYISSIFYREINGVYHNYAAASDITRSVLMYLKGGCYMDVDVVCPSLQQLGLHEIEHGYLIGKCDGKANGRTSATYNAFLVSLPKSDMSKDILERMAYEIKEFDDESEGDNLPMWVEKRSDEYSRQYKTMLLTGPDLLRDMRLHKKAGIFVDIDIRSRQNITSLTSSVYEEHNDADALLLSGLRAGFDDEGSWVSLDSAKSKDPTTI